MQMANSFRFSFFVFPLDIEYQKRYLLPYTLVNRSLCIVSAVIQGVADGSFFD